MATYSTTAPVQERSRGRGYLWAGIGMCVLALALVVAQFSLKHLMVPWYLPIMTTLGALLLLVAVAQRLTITRIVVLGLIVVLAGLQWLMMTTLKLPSYDGPARAGQPIPAFQAALADGRTFTDKDLQDGTPSVLTFFRGRW